MKYRWNRWSMGLAAILLGTPPHAANTTVPPECPGVDARKAELPPLAASQSRLPYGSGYEARHGQRHGPRLIQRRKR